jgi:hypothetical protein
VDERRLLIFLLAAVLAMGGMAASGLAGETSVSRTQTLAGSRAARTTPSPHVDSTLTRRLRATARRWEIVTGRRPARSRAPLDPRRALRFWRRRARLVVRVAAHPPHQSGWLCIHRYEASWSDRDDPYWGGLQMDRGFMRRYAPRLLLRRGLANRWSPLEQMWVAERAHRSGRGYWPWANTARACGLL